MSQWLVVGLGNPGPTYALTRHNIGFLAVDALAASWGGAFSTVSRLRTQLTKLIIPVVDQMPTTVLVAKPTTFMNDSGLAVNAILSFYKIPAAQLIVVHDELDLDPGQMRIKFGGGDNGHNGLKSIRQHLGTGQFYRVRVGIGRPFGRQAPADWVLAKVKGNTLEELQVDAQVAADGIEALITIGLAAAQNRYNS